VPPVAALRSDYLFPALPRVRELYGLVGPVARTSSFPRLQNTAFRGREVPGLFLPFYLPGLGDFVTGFWPDVPVGLHELGLPLRGLSVSGPLKEAALSVADVASPAARAAGAANALVRRGGRWWAETTDSSAVAAVLQRAGVPLVHRPAAVIGCGGAGRAAAVALKAAGAAVTMVNRNESRGRLAAELLGLPFVPLKSFTGAGCAVLVHATPVRDEVPFPLDALAGGATIFDMVSVPGETALVEAARRRGLHTIDGRALAGVEAVQQFHLMTGRTMPARLMANLASPAAWRPAPAPVPAVAQGAAATVGHPTTIGTIDGVRGVNHAPVRPGSP
jgi:3-dehydroquinate dehydratase/shikimate dehydrogenase